MPSYTQWLFPRLEETIEEAQDMLITTCFVQKYVPDLSSHFDFHIDDTFAYGEKILGLSLQSDSALSLLEEENELSSPSTSRTLAKV